MRIRTFFGLVATFTVAGSILTASSASAYQLMDRSALVPSTPTAPSADIVASGPVAAACSPDAVVGDGPLPQLGASLQAGLDAYAENPSGGDVGTWLDSGGAFGGGVPASAVRTLMRRGLAMGLSDEEVQNFLHPNFLRGVDDPRGGGSLLNFIGDQGDPTLMRQLASYAAGLDGRNEGPTSAQAHVFEAVPLLRAAYMAQAGAIPPDLATAEPMLSLANQGYVPAQDTIQAFLTAGSHPSAGAQDAGGVADLMSASVYDYFVENYAGPLTSSAAAAVANRLAYDAWVERIADWEQGGALVDEVPNPASFPATVTSSTIGSSTVTATEEVPSAAC